MTYWYGRRGLVTDGTSFISHLVDQLVVQVAKFRVADNLSSGKLENSASSIDGIKFLQGNLLDLAFAKQACEDIEQVFHSRQLPGIGWAHVTGLMQVWQDDRCRATKRGSAATGRL